MRDAIRSLWRIDGGPPSISTVSRDRGSRNPGVFTTTVPVQDSGSHEHYFQVRIYHNNGHIDCAYQLFSDQPVLRWDNKEEFPHLASYPHHFHDQHGRVGLSPLTGELVSDLKTVLGLLTEFLNEGI